MPKGNILDFLQFVEEMFLRFMFVVPDGATIGQNREDTCVIHHSHVGLVHAANCVAKHLEAGGDRDIPCCHGFDVLFVTEFRVQENSEPSREASWKNLDGFCFSVQGTGEGWGLLSWLLHSQEKWIMSDLRGSIFRLISSSIHMIHSRTARRVMRLS